MTRGCTHFFWPYGPWLWHQAHQSSAAASAFGADSWRGALFGRLQRHQHGAAVNTHGASGVLWSQDAWWRRLCSISWKILRSQLTYLSIKGSRATIKYALPRDFRLLYNVSIVSELFLDFVWSVCEMRANDIINAKSGLITPPRRSELYLVGHFLKHPLIISNCEP